MAGSKTLTAIVYSTGVVTATVSGGHGFTVGDTLLLTIAGCSPAGYNGTWLCTITSTTQFTYAVPSTLASIVTLGVVTIEDVAELVAMATTYFAQGSAQAVYVLELGQGSAAQGIASLSAYITANPNSNYTPGAAGFYYGYLVPREWASDPTYPALLADYEAPDAQTYFWTTMTLANYSSFTAQMKDVVGLIESPAYGVWPANILTVLTYSGGVVTATTTTAHGILPGEWFQIAGCTPTGYNGWFQALPGTTGSTILYAVSAALGDESVLGTLVASYQANAGITATEFSLAALFYQWLASAPSTSNNVPPFAFRYLYGVTPFPTTNNSALLATLQAASVNWIGTGAPGGIVDTCVYYGTTMDGSDILEWYAIDWAEINLVVGLSNLVIDGSNNPLAPLYYGQPGINQLQIRGQAVLNNGVSYGLLLNAVTPTVAAVPFNTYVQENPSDYEDGHYAGLSATITPARGFISIVFDMVVSFFPTGNF